MLHSWYEAIDELDIYIRVVMLDFSKTFDLIDHHLLLGKLQLYDMSSHIIIWMATYVLASTQHVKKEMNTRILAAQIGECGGEPCLDPNVSLLT